MNSQTLGLAVGIIVMFIGWAFSAGILFEKVRSLQARVKELEAEQKGLKQAQSDHDTLLAKLEGTLENLDRTLSTFMVDMKESIKALKPGY